MTDEQIEVVEIWERVDEGPKVLKGWFVGETWVSAVGTPREGERFGGIEWMKR